MNYFRFALGIFILVSFQALSTAWGQTIVESSDQILKKMTLDQKLGQLLMVGLPGKSLDAKSLELIRELKITNFILFSRNIETPKQTLELTQKLSAEALATAGLLPLIAVDQEGGSVVRVPTSPKVPSALSVSVAGSLETAYAIGRETALVLARLGINMNLAPVLDIGSINRRTFISNRSFGENPKLVSDFGLAYSKGMLSAGVIPVAKHFPGGGSAKADPHKQAVIRDMTLQQLESLDLIPFKNFTALPGNTAVMMSHVVYPKIDGTNSTAATSKKMIQEILRNRIGFNGLVISDDMMMNFKPKDQASIHENQQKLNLKPDSLGDSRAISSRAALVVKSIEAGTNLTIMSWSLPQMKLAIEALKSAVTNHQLKMATVDAAVKKIIQYKLNLPQDARNQRSIASTSVALSTKELASSVDYVLTKNADQADLNASVNLIRSLRSAKQLCVLSPDENFRKGFSSVIPNANIGQDLVSLKASNQDCGILLIGSSGGFLEQIQNKLSASQMATTIAVSFSPYNSQINGRLLAAIPLFSNFENAGKIIAERILKIRNSKYLTKN